MAGSGHSVHLYGSSDDFCSAVATYLNEALADERPAVAILTSAHRALVEPLLDRPEEVLFLDADETLDAISEDGVPVAAKFDEVVGGVIDGLAAGETQVAAVGEMVELLVERGDAGTAISLEELWNSLAWSRRFTLLCGYRRSRFEGGARADVLAEIVRTHSHVQPALAV